MELFERKKEKLVVAQAENSHNATENDNFYFLQPSFSFYTNIPLLLKVRQKLN